MRRLTSNHEFKEIMEDYSYLYCTEPPLNMGVRVQAIGEGSEQQNFGPARLFSPGMSNPFESLDSAFHASGTYMNLQQCLRQIGNPPLGSQFPTLDSNILPSQSSWSDFSIDSAEQAVSNLDYSDTLQSLAESHFRGNQCHSSLEEPNKFPHGQSILLAENNTPDGKQLDSKHGVNVCHSSSSRRAPLNKTRIKWTKNLHEQFVRTVDHLGGVEKATPKAILKLMDSDMLTILHVKSHLQKYRSARCSPEPLQEKYERRTSGNDAPQLHMRLSKQIKEALQLQLEIGNRLQEQLEQNLQTVIEEERKQLKMMLDRQRNRCKSLFNSKNSELSSQNDQRTSSQDD